MHKKYNACKVCTYVHHRLYLYGVSLYLYAVSLYLYAVSLYLYMESHSISMESHSISMESHSISMESHSLYGVSLYLYAVSLYLYGVSLVLDIHLKYNFKPYGHHINSFFSLLTLIGTSVVCIHVRYAHHTFAFPIQSTM